MTDLPDIATRLNDLIIAVNELAADVQRIQIMSQDVLLRLRQGDQDELPFADVIPITDA